MQPRSRAGARPGERQKGDSVTEDRSVLTRPAPAPDAQLRYGSEPEHVADLWRGRDDHPLIVVLHGGFWRPAYDRRHTRPMAAALRDAGATVVSVEYRRVPGDPDLATGDVATALRVLPAQAGDHSEVVVTGHSAGGHLALWAAAAAPAPNLTTTVALAPVADLALADELGLGDGATRAFLGGAAATRPDLDPVRLPPPSGEVVLVHGADDEVVPPALSRSYVEAHPDSTLQNVSGAGHFVLIDPGARAWPAVSSHLIRSHTSMYNRGGQDGYRRNP